MSSLSVENLRVSYAGRDGEVVALDGYSLNVAEGSLTVLLGESGVNAGVKGSHVAA